jgi:UDPglucose 6-dehydrogenase
MAKRICVVGTGYVGLIAAVGLSDFGNRVVGVDLDEAKVNQLSKGVSPIYEPGVEVYLKRNLESGRLRFTTNIDQSIQDSEVILIAVGTPPKENGEADLKFVKNVTESIGKNLNEYKVVVTKSTVPVGTNRKIKRWIQEAAPGKDFDVVSNPEFLREGKATQDFFHPDRTVIGFEREKAKEIMFEVYRTLNITSVPFVWCSLETAELIKYASNAFLATKITFINQMANLADAVGADIHQVAKTMGMDGRISSKFLHPGPGYGGSCFPKDTRAVIQTGSQYDVDMSLIRSVVEANEQQKSLMVDKLIKLIGPLKDKIIGILGLAFKQETDDIRETPAITIVTKILELGAKIQAHDPKAIENFKKLFPGLDYKSSPYEAADGADALIILTEWNEYRSIDLERVYASMQGKSILDSRNILDPQITQEIGFTYQGVGRK